MPRSKKAPIYKYGLEITKPFSKAMYDHNDQVADEMRARILEAWNQELKTLTDTPNSVDIKTEDWDEELLKEHAPKLVKLQRGVCYSGYGSGYTIDMVNQEFIKELEGMANWQLHEEYSYLCFENLVHRTTFMMVGFDWAKHEYDGRVVANNELVSDFAPMEGEIELTK